LVKVILIVISVFLSGCTSSQAIRSGCDFVTGAAKSNERHKHASGLNSNDKNQNVNVINGLLNMLFGPIGRSLNDDECSSKQQEHIYPNNTL
jgi:hypothetical protein